MYRRTKENGSCPLCREDIPFASILAIPFPVGKTTLLYGGQACTVAVKDILLDSDEKYRMRRIEYGDKVMNMVIRS